MVPLLPPRLRTAVELHGVKVAQLAKQMGRGESRQTLHHLMQGEQPTKCRQSRRRKLARLLEVSEKYLAGEPVELELTGFAHFELMRRWSARMALAYSRLIERCQQAVIRDLAHYRAEPDIGDMWNASEHVRFFISWAIGQLVTPHMWRDRLVREVSPLVPPPLTRAERDLREGKWTFDSIEPITPAEELAALSLIRSWDYVFRPWYAGGAALDYAALALLVSSQLGDVPRMLPQCERPKVIVRDDGQSFAPEHPSTPYCVLRWPESTTETI